MSTFEVWIIIILVIGVIASNLAVLKYSAKFKMPQFGDPKKTTKKPHAPTSDNKNSQSGSSTSSEDKK